LSPGTAAAGPLHDTRVLITRPREQSDALAAAVRAAGGEPLLLPAIDIEAVPLEPTLAAITVAPAHPRVELVIFISGNAVRFGTPVLTHERLRGARVAAIGEATAQALRAAGIAVDIVPERGFTSEDLLAHPALNAPQRALRSVLIVRGEGGRDLLAETLRARGAQVALLDVYRRVCPPPPSADVRARLRQGPIQLVTATSVEIIHNLLQMLGEDARALQAQSRLIVPSDRVLAAAIDAGFRQPPVRSRSAANAALLDAMIAARTGS
jgi:uroporphyrinogen-III synthase